MKIPGANQIEA